MHWPKSHHIKIPQVLILLVLGIRGHCEGPGLEVRETQVGEFQCELRQGVELEFIHHGKKTATVQIEGELARGEEVLVKADEEMAVPGGQRRGFRMAVDRKMGQFQVRYRVLSPGIEKPLADRSFEFESGGPLEVGLWPFYLGRNGVLARCRVDALGQAREYDWKAFLQDAHGNTVAESSERTALEVAHLPLFAKELAAGRYTAVVEVRNEQREWLGRRRVAFERPESPGWWKLGAGHDPAVPEPWSPIEVKEVLGSDGRRKVAAGVWGREYVFGDQALPVQVQNQGESLLAGPMRLEAWSPTGTRANEIGGWEASEIQRDPESITLGSATARGGYAMGVRTRLEFDGFLRVDLTLTPVAGAVPVVQPLCLRIPVKASAATHLTNYRNAPGPGEAVPRFVGKIPPEGEDYESPVMLTTWLGGDRGGLEWSAESSKGWSLADPQRALRVWREGDTVWFEARLVSRPLALKAVRTITFGLVATPTKPLPRDWTRWRVYDNVQCWHLPYDWSGYDAWHPEVTDPVRIADQRRKYQEQHDLGRKVLVNGGWAISEVAPQWPTWSLEMVSEPLSPTIWEQFDGCTNTPYLDFMVNSFAANARKLGFDGIRFDTVVPWKPCWSEWHGCAWRGDDGQLYGTQNLWRQREWMKRMYRLFHGGVIDGGIIYLPVAGPPLMCIESFEDIHETSEGYYMKAASLKEGYSQERVRVWMTGTPYGFMVQNSIKGEPLAPNERIGALLVAGAEPRFAYTWHLSPLDYARMSIPAAAIWDAWDWIDRSAAEWHPHWQNGDRIAVEPDEKELYASFYLQPGRKALLVLTNYEKEHLAEVVVRWNLPLLGFPAELYARDAITLETIPIDGGTFSLSLLPERYRLIQVSTQPFPPAPEAMKSRAQKRPPEAVDFSNLRLGKNLLRNPGFEEWTGDEDRDDVDDAADEPGEGEGEAQASAPLPPGGESPSLKKWREEWAEGALSLPHWSSLGNQVADHAFRDPDVKRSGEYSLRLEIGRGFNVIQYLGVQPRTRYAVEAWVKVKGHLRGGKVGIVVEGNLGGSANVVAEDNGRWQRLAGIIETRETDDRASFQIRVDNQGFLWIDDLGMYPVFDSDSDSDPGVGEP
ncbi:MAG: hypothetical protein HYU36_14165 [Planctomycetes bacterium]|nr:hypothetical protein [Planctomycetota bacterium]